jgi:ribosomal protein L11 methyltransferase
VIRLALRVRREEAELVLAELLELAPGGVEESEQDANTIEYAIYGVPGELPELPDLQAVAGDALVEISTTLIAGDWSQRWKRFHRPVLVEAPDRAPDRDRVPALHVRPPWESPSARPDAREIVIDPGQAFGTGGHASTRLCLELLLELAASDDRRCPALDIGTGSGVLAIAAARLGYGPVIALDNDRESVCAASENAAVNGVTIEVRHFNLHREPLPAVGGSPAPVVLANLLRPLLLELSRSLEHPPDHLIVSGLLKGEAEEVSEAFARRLGLCERARHESGEWAAAWLSAP